MNTLKNPPALGPLMQAVDAFAIPFYRLAEALLRGMSILRQRLARGRERRRRERDIAHTLRQLSGLDDRVLRDIGIARGNLLAVSVAVVEKPGCDPRKLHGE